MCPTHQDREFWDSSSASLGNGKIDPGTHQLLKIGCRNLRWGLDYGMDPGNVLWLHVSGDIEFRCLIEPRQEASGCQSGKLVVWEC